jgi:hypothetical protein
VGLGLILISTASAQTNGFNVTLYTANPPPPTPALDELPLVTQVSQDGVTWTFSEPRRVGRFVNGDYYVVGNTTVTDIKPLGNTTNGRNGSMLNIQPNIQRSGWDSRIPSGRYNAALRVYAPVSLTPGNKLLSSRSVGTTNLAAVMRPIEVSVSPVASISILTCVAGPQPLDAFRPSYAQGSTNIYLSRNLRRQILPRLAPVAHVPPFGELENYLRRPWVDSVFFNFDVPSEYMASYGRENAYLMSFAGLMLTLDVPAEQKEPLLVYLTQYGIDLNGLVQQGHEGWQAFGGHGSGRKFPLVFAGMMLDEPEMKSPSADFGEDQHTIWVRDTPVSGTYTQSWHTPPETVVYSGHVGVNGESVNPGWGPYEHLPPSQWKSTLGESYRRCCTSVSWVGEALASRLIPGMRAAWNHPPFFAYVDRWMFTPDNPADLEAMRAAWGLSFDASFRQGQSWRILSGGGYTAAHRTFVDEMWDAYRYRPEVTIGAGPANGAPAFAVENVEPRSTNWVQATSDPATQPWTTIWTNIPGGDRFDFSDFAASDARRRFYRIKGQPAP